MRSLTPRQFIELRHGDAIEPLLLDVREPWEHDICRVAGSTLLPMSRIDEALQQLDRQRPTVVLCHHGIRSRQVARYLSGKGFAEVYNLEGGISAWARELDPEMPDY